jgi:single-strand DNA-binding protein
VLNKVILIGRMCFDAELRYTPSGQAVSNFRIAVDRRFPTAQGERETDFVDIVAWRQNAEFSANYCTKGRLVLVEGRLQVRNWETSEGQKRRSYEVVADWVRALDRPKEGEPQAAGEETPPRPESASETGSGSDPLSEE